MTTTKPHLIFAPLRGITDYHFRNIFSRHFSGFDSAIAPFITPQVNTDFPDKLLKDILPVNNNGFPIIPQILHTQPEPFVALARKLAGYGYDHINWNLGCPAPQVVNKKKGSGILPYPEKICYILDAVLPELEKSGCNLSIKMRLGLSEVEEGKKVLRQLNGYPIKEITLHARLGKQMYKGTPDIEGFNDSTKLSSRPIIYNGDITSVDDFMTLQKQIPFVAGWMIGRGAIMNPFIGDMIQGKNIHNSRDVLQNFHGDLYKEYKSFLFGDSHLTGRMKLIWQYLIASFPEAGKKGLKKIQKSRTAKQYETAVAEIFAA